MKKLLLDIIGEMRAITWPTGRQLITATIFTIIICAIITLAILGFDLMFVRLREVILNL